MTQYGLLLKKYVYNNEEAAVIILYLTKMEFKAQKVEYDKNSHVLDIYSGVQINIESCYKNMVNVFGKLLNHNTVSGIFKKIKDPKDISTYNNLMKLISNAINTTSLFIKGITLLNKNIAHIQL